MLLLPTCSPARCTTWYHQASSVAPTSQPALLLQQQCVLPITHEHASFQAGSHPAVAKPHLGRLFGMLVITSFKGGIVLAASLERSLMGMSGTPSRTKPRQCRFVSAEASFVSVRSRCRYARPAVAL